MKNHPVNNDYVQNLVEGLVRGKIKKDDNSYSGLSDSQGYPVRIGGNSSGVKEKKKLDSAEERIKKELKLENAEKGYSEEGIEGKRYLKKKFS